MQAIFYSEELLEPVNHTKADSILTHHQGNSMKGDSKLHQSRDANITVGDSVNELPHSNTGVIRSNILVTFSRKPKLQALHAHVPQLLYASQHCSLPYASQSRGTYGYLKCTLIVVCHCRC